MEKTHSNIFADADSLEKEVQVVSFTKEGSYDLNEMHRHNYFEMFYFKNASGLHKIDFQEFQIENSSIHIVPPGSLHQIRRSTDSEGKVLLFTKTFLYSLLDFTPASHINAWKANPVFKLNQRELAFIDLCFNQMEDELKQHRLNQLSVMGSLLQMISILLMRQASVNEVVNNDLTASFFELLEQNFTTTTGARDYAEKLGLSLNKLNDALRKSGNPSTKNCITERKILEAKRLLLHSKWSVKETAYYLGYSDPNYLSKVFKNTCGYAISAFLENNRQK